MIKIDITVVGKDKDAWVADGCIHFVKLLSRYARVAFTTIPALKKTASLNPAEVMKKEAELIEKRLGGASYVALADFGRQMDSPAFASWLEKASSGGGGRITFVIGGAYGLDGSILDKADEVLSLSDLTFSHQLVRLVLLEQLYRGFSIVQGTGYHK